MIDEIPEAIRERESIEVKRSSRSPLKAISRGLIGAGILGVSAVFLFSFWDEPAKEKEVTDLTSEAEPVQPQIIEEPAVNSPVRSNPEPETAEDLAIENLLGHLPYEEAASEDLVALTADGRIRLRQSAATKFQQMQAAAAAEGINLVPISGFRSISAQEQLFFAIKEQREQDAETRAEVSAPPGYSEHHTGYTIDIGDGNVPETHVDEDFARTAAFRWLQANAVRYSFEMSFPRDNPQGISYEPWHWRFVGDRDSLETFYKVRNRARELDEDFSISE